jgi:hypothetical protein
MFIWEVLIFTAKKIIFHFLSAKMGFFVKHLQKYVPKLTNTILNDIIPYFIQNSPVVCMIFFYSHRSRN